MKILTQEQIATAFRALGVAAGDIVFVHSSLSSIGHVAGGGETVVDALLEVLGPSGTLAFPTFIFSQNQNPTPIFDPQRDPSEMGQISEAARTRPGALRSHHISGAVGALGPSAAEITSHHGTLVWAADSPFWKFYELDARIMLLGVPYLRCTYFHMLEQLVQVSYRWWRKVDGRIRYPDGTEGPLPAVIFSPYPDFPGNDFNKLGAMLEAQGLVRVGPVGNAVARLFSAQAALKIGLEAYRQDHDLFLKSDGQFTQLQDGVMVGELHNEKTVYDPSLMYPRASKAG
ncbi:MAG: AAC(3) family N-acetyltransferase [Chloroflexi bacterium]|nr:AAC(3) family N-acetyltransferase [Chloroflexota bacterium]